jgi:hypothetical protein
MRLQSTEVQEEAVATKQEISMKQIASRAR